MSQNRMALRGGLACPTSCVALCLSAALGGCTASSAEVAPPQYDPYFPTALVVSPDERFLFVLSSNADLRFDSGTVQVIDLEQVDSLASQWVGGATPQGCAPDPLNRTVLACDSSTEDGSPSSFLVGGASVKLGNFGAGLSVQQLERTGAPSPVVRVFATVRGDPSLTWMDFDTSTRGMDCGGDGDFARCSQDHRLGQFRGDGLFLLSQEPFYVYVDPTGEHAFVTHLTGLGEVSMASAPIDEGKTPRLSSFIGTLWSPSGTTGQMGSVGVAARIPGDPLGYVYVTSRHEAKVAMLRVAEGPPDEDGNPTEQLVGSGAFFLFGLVGGGLSADTRGIAFSSDGNRAFIVSRSPPSLMVYNTQLTATGVPANVFLGSIEVCLQPAAIAVSGPYAYLPCFGTGQLWVVDTQRMSLVATPDVGRGPTAVAVAPGRGKIYVANYAEDTIAVVAAGNSRTLMRLGSKRAREDQ